MAEYIDKEAAIAIIEDRQKQLCPVGMYSRHAVYGTDREKYDAWQEILDEIDYLPAADVRENVKGKWIPVTNGRGGSECNLCHAYAPNYQSGAQYNSPYCPNCGAQMGGAEDG